MQGDVEAFFDAQDEHMTLLNEDFDEFLLRKSPVRHQPPHEQPISSVPSIPFQLAGRVTLIAAPEDLSSLEHDSGTREVTCVDVPTSPRPSSRKRKNPQESVTLDIKKRSRTGKDKTPTSELIEPRPSTRSNTRVKGAGTEASSSKLKIHESSSSIEEITRDTFDASARAITYPFSAVKDVASLPPAALPTAGLSFLEAQVASRVSNYANKKSLPRVHKGGKPKPVVDSQPDRSPNTVSPGPSPAALSRCQTQDQTVDTKAIAPQKKPIAKKNNKSFQVKPTPEEYARGLLEKGGVKSKPVPLFLKGRTIFYCGGEHGSASETTMRRMDLLVKFGATLQPTFDAGTATHIIVPDSDKVKLGTLLAKLQFKSHKQIPEHIPTFKWSWLADACSLANRTTDVNKVIKLQDYWEATAYRERFDAGQPKRQESSLIRANSHKMNFKAKHDLESDSEKEAEEPRPQHQPERSEDQHASGSKSARRDDPLAEFYAEAAAEYHEQWSRHGEVDESEAYATDRGNDTESDNDTEPALAKKTTGRRGFACDIKNFAPTTCINQDIIDKLSELMELHKAKPGQEDKWRVFSYSKAIRALKSHPTRIKSYSQAVAIRSIGKKTAEKIQEIISTGNLRRIGHENTDDVKVTRLFQGIYGVGQKTAIQWYSNGCRTLDDLRSGKCGIKLSDCQRIGLDNYDDINSRMPRDEARAIFELIKPIALNIDSGLCVEIMGSYRRGKKDCGDIDILLTRPTSDGRTHAGILATLLQKLHDDGILTDDLALPEDPWDEEAIYRGLCHLPQQGSRKRRIDFLTVPWTSRGAALLYYTGDDIFNRAMRLKANHRGYSLNQKGLFEGVVRDPRNRTIKLNTGTLLASETEEEIFKILEVPYQEPHERVRNFV